MTDTRRRTFRRWWVQAGPVFKVASNDVFGLTNRQLAEWDQWLTERRPNKRIHLGAL